MGLIPAEYWGTRRSSTSRRVWIVICIHVDNNNSLIMIPALARTPRRRDASSTMVFALALCLCATRIYDKFGRENERASKRAIRQIVIRTKGYMFTRREIDMSTFEGTSLTTSSYHIGHLLLLLLLHRAVFHGRH